MDGSKAAGPLRPRGGHGSGASQTRAQLRPSHTRVAFPASWGPRGRFAQDSGAQSTQRSLGHFRDRARASPSNTGLDSVLYVTQRAWVWVCVSVVCTDLTHDEFFRNVSNHVNQGKGEFWFDILPRLQCHLQESSRCVNAVVSSVAQTAPSLRPETTFPAPRAAHVVMIELTFSVKRHVLFTSVILEAGYVDT